VRLPYGWIECVTEDGTPYYYNKVTQESSWELMPSQHLLNNWRMCYSDDGVEYYYNDLTGESTWKVPESALPPADYLSSDDDMIMKVLSHHSAEDKYLSPRPRLPSISRSSVKANLTTNHSDVGKNESTNVTEGHESSATKFSNEILESSADRAVDTAPTQEKSTNKLNGIINNALDTQKSSQLKPDQVSIDDNKSQSKAGEANDKQISSGDISAVVDPPDKNIAMEPIDVSLDSIKMNDSQIKMADHEGSAMAMQQPSNSEVIDEKGDGSYYFGYEFYINAEGIVKQTNHNSADIDPNIQVNVDDDLDTAISDVRKRYQGLDDSLTPTGIKNTGNEETMEGYNADLDKTGPTLNEVCNNYLYFN
jgi:hypothetical protein